MSDHYIYHKDSIEDIAQLSESTVKDLKDILQKAESLKDKVASYEGWKGKQKNELMTFLELLIPYHKDLVQKEDSPFSQYKKSLKLLNENLNKYSGYSKSYKELKTK